MVKILNFGSLNIDFVYSVDHIVKPGETISSTNLEVFPGGKGLNQSVALARAGAQVYHAGIVGQDGQMLVDVCDKNGINHEHLDVSSKRTGNAIIQVSKSGQNSIVLFGGANRQNTKEFVDRVLESFDEGDVILLQNEMNLVEYMIERAYEKKMVIALNPSPFDEMLLTCDLSKVSIFIMNEVEGDQITGEKEPEKILANLRDKFPETKIVLTLGKVGAVYQDKATTCSHGIYDVKVVDTTAAGDTFTGFFLTTAVSGKPIAEALRIASVASSIAVSKKGATNSIPSLKEVLASDLIMI